MNRHCILAVCVSMVVALGNGAASGYESQTVLGIEDEHFTINGETTFLLGVSAMDAIGQMQAEHLDWLKDRQFNLIRVWGWWAQQLLTQHAPTVKKMTRQNILWHADGSLRPEKIHELRTLLTLTDQRGIIVDITVFSTFQSFLDDSDLTIRSRALKELSEAIKDFKNVIYDVTNEHNNFGFMASHPDLRIMRDAVKAVDPRRIVTASNVHGALGHIPLEKVMPAYLTEITDVKLDVMTPHFARTPDFAAKTAGRLQLLRKTLRENGIRVPIYLQEEARRRHSRLNPSVEEFLLSARNAKENGAAAWVFHTDAGYNMEAGPIYECMDDVEQEVANKVGRELSAVECRALRSDRILGFDQRVH